MTVKNFFFGGGGWELEGVGGGGWEGVGARSLVLCLIPLFFVKVVNHSNNCEPWTPMYQYNFILRSCELLSLKHTYVCGSPV